MTVAAIIYVAAAGMHAGWWLRGELPASGRLLLLGLVVGLFWPVALALGVVGFVLDVFVDRWRR